MVAPFPQEASSDDETDIFSQGWSHLFGLPEINLGDHGESATVQFPKGCSSPIHLQVADVDAKNTKLFAHHIWKASILLGKHLTEEMDAKTELEGKYVLELGAGAGIPSILCARLGCNVTASDYPDEHLIANLKRNLAANCRPFASSVASASLEEESNAQKSANVKVLAHIWGERNDLFFKDIGETKFDYILLADTLWMAHQHENLLNDLCDLLAPQGRILGVAGLHSGLKTVNDFFKLAATDRYGFKWSRKLYKIPVGHGFCEDAKWEVVEREDCVVDEPGERLWWLFKYEMSFSGGQK